MSVPAQDPQVLPSDKGVDSAPAPPDTEQSTETDDMSIDNDGVKDATSIPLYLYGYSSRDNDTETEHKGSSSTASGTENTSTGPLPLLSRSENLCVRHQRMADEGANARLQKVRSYFDASACVTACAQEATVRLYTACFPWPSLWRECYMLDKIRAV